MGCLDVEQLAGQARALFSELPAGEIADEEALRFTVADNGRLTVLQERTGATFTLLEGMAWRGRALPGGRVELVAFRGGKPMHLAEVTAEELEASMWPTNRIPND